MLGRLVIFISWDHISPTHLLSIIFKNIYRGIQTTLTEQVATPMLLLSLMVSVGLFLVWEGLGCTVFSRHGLGMLVVIIFLTYYPSLFGH